MENTSKWRVCLEYSSDNIPLEKELEKISELYKGSDLVTKVLNYFQIPFIVELLSDFHAGEPVLSRVSRYDKNGIEFTLYNEWESSYMPISGKNDVLRQLELLGVIPCSVKEAINKVGGKLE